MNNIKINFKSIAWSILLFAGIIFTFQSCKEKKKEVTEGKEETIQMEEDGFTPIFDGKTLDNWKGDGIHWRAENGLSLIHISEPTRRTPISYAVFCLKK